MASKAGTGLTAEAVRDAIETARPTSMTRLAHALGHKGTVSGSLTRRLRALVPGIDGMLAAHRPAEGGESDAAGKTAKATPVHDKPSPAVGAKGCRNDQRLRPL